MATQQVKLKTRVGASRPAFEREEKSLSDTAQELIKAIEEGVFDAHLDLIDKAIYERIRKSQEEDGDPLPDPRERVEKIRVIRSGPASILSGQKYRLRGQKYAGITVKFIAMAEVPESDGLYRAKVEVVYGNATLVAGKVYKVPTAALEEIPNMHAEPPKKDAYGHSLKDCRKCGGPVEYSGKGRPPVLCADCK